jgi:hypothetical protein
MGVLLARFLPSGDTALAQLVDEEEDIMRYDILSHLH